MNLEPRSARDLQPEGSDSEDNHPCYLEPWIVNLLLEYKESEAEEDGQLGHILKVLNEARALHHNEQCPAAVLCITDGRHSIQVEVTSKATQMTKCSLPQSGFSSIVGQFIVLQNYRVCFKKAAKMEDCQFYLVLDCFRVMPMKRQEIRQRDCNREPSVLEKIKELWQKSFALQPWSNSEPSMVSEVLSEIQQDQLNTLKQNAKDCLNLSNSSRLLDSEQLAAYPETKWQAERRQDKIYQDTFSIPAKLLEISAENEALLSKAYPPKPSPAIPEGTQDDDDHSTVSFFSAESENLHGSLENPCSFSKENPWDVFPGMSLSTSSDTSGSPPSLLHTQQVHLANTAEEEEEIPCSSSCTPDLLEPHAPTSHSTSGRVESVETVSSSLLPVHNTTPLKESANQESSTVALNTARNVSNISSDETVPCGHPLRNLHSQTSMCLWSPVQSSVRRDNFLETSSKNTDFQRDKVVVREAGGEILNRGKKCMAAKRKQMVSDEEPSTETCSSPSCTGLKAPGHHSAEAASPESSHPNVHKRSQIKERHIQQQHQASAQFRCTDRVLAKGKEQGATTAIMRRPEEQIGLQQQKRVRGTPLPITYKPPTSELCSQVRSARISKALLGWALWVFNSTKNQ